MPNREIKIGLNNEITIGHGEIFNDDVGGSFAQVSSILYADEVKQDGEDGVRHDDRNDTGHHRRGGCIPDS